MNARVARITHVLGVIEATAVFLFFYQALRVLFSVLFGVIYDALFAEIVPMTTVGLILLVVILALLAPLAAPRRPKARRTVLLIAAMLVFLGRVPLSLNDPQVRLAAAIIIVAGTGLYLATRLRNGSRGVVRALVLALIVDQLLRAAGHTFDVTLRPEWWPGQVAVSLSLYLMAGWLYRQRPVEEQPPGPRLGIRLGLVWGSWLFLQTSLLAFPNAMTRWSDGSYLLFASSWPFAMVLIFLGDRLWKAWRGWIDGVIVLAILLGGMALGYLLTGPVAFLGLLMAQLAALILLHSCFSLHANPQRDRLGPGLALGGILFLVLSFAYAFAFTYAYTLDLFRDMGLPIFLLAGLLAALPSLTLPATAERVPWPPWRRVFTAWAAGAVLVALVLALTGPRWWPEVTGGDSFRAATYNIHYGYDTHWHLSLEAQAQTIEASGADVVALQEVDTGRPTSYMIDDALWLARRLDMEVVYQPTVEYLTGIALLSRYPVIDSEALLLPSELEQTGIIWARLDTGDTPVNAFAIWLGLEPEERARQLDAALPFIAAHPGPAIFGGDFNSTPNSPVYARIADAGFVDPFVALGLGSPPTDPAINPTKRIDFVWLRDLVPLDARVLDSTASDHRMVVVEVQLP